jgi:hypothetical protein
VRIPRHKTILLLLAALVALAIAGCGGGGGGETTDAAVTTTEEPQKLTKAELIEQGDSICAEVNAAVGALSSETEETAVPETIEKTSNLYLGMVERLQELGSPEGDDGSYANVMEAAEELAKVEGEVKLAAEREDTEALGEAATEAAPALEEFEQQADIYGFEDCSKGPGAPTAAGTAGDDTGAEAPGEEVAPELEEEGGVEPEYVEPEYEEPAPEEEVAPETGGAGGGSEAPEPAPEIGGESGGVGPG